MKKSLILLPLFLLSIITSCKQNDTKKEGENEKQIEQKELVTKDNTKIGRKNFVIIWKWTTTDVKLVENNLAKISEEINSIWKDDIITDAYYNSNPAIDKLAYFPNVSFVLKANTLKEVEEELNKLALVKERIASYSIYPVGTKWLGRDSDKISNKGITFSYASVWENKNLDKASDDLIKSQSDIILKLWNEGKIENVYFDIEGTQKSNEVTDFVFFINANTLEEAKKMCNEMPFVKEDISSFKLYSVGVFWLGEDTK